METKKIGIELLDKNKIRLNIEIYGGDIYELRGVFEYDKELNEYIKKDIPPNEHYPPWDRFVKIGITFNKNFKKGVYKEYFNSNRIRRILPFIYNKEMDNYHSHGLEKVYYEGPDDKSQNDIYVIFLENNYLEGLSIGLQKRYYINGNLQNEVMMKKKGWGNNFSVHNEYYKIYYHDSGNLEKEVYPNWGRKYYETGQLMVEWKSIDYSIIGEYVEKYPSGSIKSKVNYVNGRKNGVMNKYYEDGSLQMKGNYVDDGRDGTRYEYYPNGTFKEVGEYTKGNKKHIKKFFPNGKLKSEFIYANGKVITKKEYKINER